MKLKQIFVDFVGFSVWLAVCFELRVTSFAGRFAMYIGCLSIGGVRMNHCRLLYGVILWNTLYETAKLHHFVYFLGSATLRNKMK